MWTSVAAGYGQVLQAFVVYLMVMHHIPAHRCVALLESSTGAAPGVGFAHGMLARTAGLLAASITAVTTPLPPRRPGRACA